MKPSEKLKKYIVQIIREESEELRNRESLLEENVRNLNRAIAGYEKLTENVRNLNAIVAGYETLAENVRNLNAAMEGQEALAENVRNLNAAMEGQEALAENVRNLNAVMAGYEALAENVRNLNAAMEGQEALAENVRSLNAAVAEQGALAENVRNLNAVVAGYEALSENVRNLNGILHTLNNEIEIIKNNNALIETRRLLLEMKHEKADIPNDVINAECNHRMVSENSTKSEKEVSPLTENVYAGIDYFDFENHFRGSVEKVKRNQWEYVKYFEGKKNVIDLGCGRGEFLELLKERGIEAKGVDLYNEFAAVCQMNGLNVTCGDALHFLNTQQKVGGIFAAQLIEHLTINQLVELCRLAFEKLEEGAYIVMETPNPTCLTIFSNAFYVDPSHNKPIHPLTAEYILRQSGFSDIEIIYTDISRNTCFIPTISGVENAVQFNEAMHVVSEILFGSQDYAIIARKHDDREKAS